MKIIICLLALMPAVAMAQSCGEIAQEFWQAASYRDMSMPPKSAVVLIASKAMQPTKIDKQIVTDVYFKAPKNSTPEQIGRAVYKVCHKRRTDNPDSDLTLDGIVIPSGQ